MLHKKLSAVDNNKLKFHKKLLYVKQKKADVARKSVSCLQKQDHAAQNFFVCAQNNYEWRTSEWRATDNIKEKVLVIIKNTTFFYFATPANISHVVFK